MYCGFIVELGKVWKHPNADRLQCTEIFGNNIIVGMDSFEGQRVVFFPVDGQLDKEYAMENNLLRLKDEQGNQIGGYMDPDKRNIKAIRIRGERSEGLVLPIKSLSPYVDVDSLKTGEEITVLNGVEICKKYIPYKRERPKSGESKEKQQKRKLEEMYPIFHEHVDTKQLMYNEAAFKPGDWCIITLKLHGTSGRTSNSLEVIKKPQKWYQRLLKKKPEVVRSWKPVSGSRRRILKDYKIGDGFYGKCDFREKYHDYFAGKLEKGETVYYEIVGYVDKDFPIMGEVSLKKLHDKQLIKQYGDTMVFSYGCKNGESDIYVYRMTMTNEDGYTVEYSDALLRMRCEQLGVKCVPKFEEFMFTTWEDLISRVEKYYDGPDPIDGTHIREGVVVRIENREQFKVYKHKNFTFKLVSGIISESVVADNMSEDILEEL